MGALLLVVLTDRRAVPRNVAQLGYDFVPLPPALPLAGILLFPACGFVTFFAVVLFYAALDVAVVDLGPCFVEALVLPVGQVELFPAGVARGDQHMNMRIVGVGVKRIERRVVPEPGILDPLLGHGHRLVAFHFPIEAQHRPVVAPLSPALLGVFA